MENDLNLTPGLHVTYIPFDGCDKSLYENGIVNYPPTLKSDEWAFAPFQ